MGTFTVHILQGVFYQYSDSRIGLMTLPLWLRFCEESQLLRSHCHHDDQGRPIVDNSDLDPELLFKTMLFSYNREEEGGADYSHFVALMVRVAKAAFPKLYDKDSGAALDRIMKQVVLPLFMMGSEAVVELSGPSATTLDDMRIFLLLSEYTSNLWRVFRSYSHDPLGRTPLTNEVFPLDAQTSERNLAILITGKAQVGDRLG